MSTISNERLEKLSEYDCADRYEVMSMATELLALRKEREKAEPVATLYKAGNSAKVIMIGADLTDGYTDVFAELQPAPPAPTDITAQQFESLAGKAVGGWIPCSERMPEEGVSVLTCCKCGDNFSGIYTMRASVIRSKNSRKDDSLVHHERVTHWQPLPEPPCK
ncbi:DUF551 domain-containing protein [Cronobacter turicensis]